jgi:hypothetical protein
MLEKEVEKKIGDYAKLRGCMYYKFSSPSNRGVPDRIVISPKGVVMFLELKAPGKKPTKLQLREISKLEKNNVMATWCDDVISGKLLIESICK